MNLNYKIFLLEDNGNYAQLDSDGLDFTTTFSVSEISDISQRKDRLSKNILLKGTKNNNRIFGNLYNFSRYSDSTLDEKLFANYSPNRAVDCLVFENSTLLFKGSLKVIEIDKDKFGNVTYEAVITGYFITFFGKIGDDLLTSVTGFTSSHTYSIAAIQNSWDFGYTDQYVYSNIDYGAGIVPDPARFDLRNFRCGIYLNYYLDTIFKYYGYTYSGSFIESDIFKKAFIPYSEKDFARYIYEPIYDVTTSGNTYTMTASDTSTFQFQGVNFTGATSNSYVTKTTNEFYPGMFVDCFNFNRNVTTDGYVKVNFSAHTIVSHDFGVFRLGVYPIINNLYDNPIFNKEYQLNNTNTSISDTIEVKIPFQSYTDAQGWAIIATLGDVYSETTTCSFTVNSAEFKYGNSLEESQVEIKIGDNVYLQDILPQNVKVVDFLKSVLQMFNLYMSEDPDNPTNVIIEPYDVFYDRCNTPAQYALDWTKKVDYSNGYKMLINTELPKEYDFKWTDDSDYYNSLYKQKYNDNYGNFSITNSKGTADPIEITSTFSPTVVVLENNDDKIMPAIYNGDISKKEPLKSNLRMLYSNGAQSCNSYDITLISQSTGGTISYTTIQTGLTSYHQSHHILTSSGTPIFNLQYGVPKEVYCPVTQDIFSIPYIYSAFYQNQLKELNNDNIFILQCEVALNEVDVSNLDFRTPIYIQNGDGGAYFKLNTIDYYNSQELSPIKLQKVIL